ncbi:hypothetical protein Tco_0122732 [Tanacetum coccineum]
MVVYLKKPTRSERFQEIVYFLNESHIRFSLTKNPTIYVSLIEQFWQTATVRTVDNGEQEITTTVDCKEFTITEASVRRHLQLADVDGISVLPTTKFFSQLSLMGYVLTDDKLTFQKAEEGEGSGHLSETQPPPSTAQPIHEEPIPNVVSSSHQKTQTPKQALNQVTELPQTSKPITNVPDKAIYEEWDDRVERATTTAASLDAAHTSGGSLRCQEATGGSIAQIRSERVPTSPHDLPFLRVNTLGSDEGSMSLHELTVLCTKLFSKVESLEADLKQTKQVYGATYTKLIMKVKKLEKTVKISQAKRRAKIVVSNDEEDLEDYSKQGRMIEEIDQDAVATLVTHTHSQEDQPEDQLGFFSTAKNEEWDASNPEFHALFILEDGASVAKVWGVKGCTIIAIIYDLGVTAREVRRTRKIVRRTWCVIKWPLFRLEVRRTKRFVRRTLASLINSSLDFLLDSSYNDC